MPQSPSSRVVRSGNPNISTPIPSSRIGLARTPLSSNYMEDALHDSDFYAASPSMRAPAYQVTRVPSSPILPRPSAFYDPVMEQQYIESDPYRAFPSFNDGQTSTQTTELAGDADSNLSYLETQSPPPYVDDLPERKRRMRRKRSESRMSVNDGGSEFGDEYEDAADAALAAYPRSSRGPIAKKKRHMTEDEKVEAGRLTKISGRSQGKRGRHHYIDDDTRSETSERAQTPSKRRRLAEQDAHDLEDDVYDEPMQIDGDYGSESEWATGPSPLRRRSSSSSHYSAQGDLQTMSRSRPASSAKRSRSKSRRREVPIEDDHISVNGNGMEVSEPQTDAANGGLLSHSPSSVKSISNLSSLAHASSTTANTPRLTTPALSTVGSVMGSVAVTPAGSTNPSPTKNGETNSEAIPILTPQHSGVFGVPLPSTPSSLLATSARQSRLQLLRDQSHNIGSPSTPASSIQTPTTSTNTISRIPLSYSASKRSLEPPVVSFTPVADPISPRATTPEITGPSDGASSSASKEIPVRETLVVTDVSEPEEDNRISHLLNNAHQRKEDKEVKIKQAEQKEKEKQELQTTLKAGLFKPLGSTAAPASSTSDENGDAADKPATSAPKFGGFKPPSATPAATSAEGTPKPAFNVPASVEPKKPLFGAPKDGAAASSPATPAKPSLFGAKPSASAAPAADGEAAPASAAPKPSLFSAPKPITTTPGAETAAPKPSLFGAPKPTAPADDASSASVAPAATKFGVSLGAAPAASTAPKPSLFGAKPTTAAAAPASPAPTGLFGGSSAASAAPAPVATAASPFGAKPPTTFGGAKPTTATAPTGLFGSSASTAPKPFGATAAPTSNGLMNPGYGAAPSNDGGMMTSPDKPAGFGAPSAAGGFGASTAKAPTGLFGGTPSTPTATPAAGGFGSTAGAFGASKPSTPAAGGFGATTGASAGGFGSTAGAFGAAKPTAPAAGGFGTPTSTNKPAPSGLFGGTPAASPAPSAGGFGASKPAGGFGSTASTGGFGATATTTPAAGGFGASASAAFGAAKPATGGFGASTASPATGGFGATTTSAAAAFGASKPATGGFGSTAAGFGSTASPAAGGFGSSTGSGFGAQPAAGGFGAASSSPAPTGLFGGGGSGSSSPAPSAGGFPVNPVRQRAVRRR